MLQSRMRSRFVPLVAAAFLCAPALVGLSPAAGASCTIVGTSGNDKLQGTKRADVICGLGGDDRIYGGAGNDTILGGPGDDQIFGDGGADRLEGNGGNDELLGRTGNDTLLGGDGNDALVDEDGTDTSNGGAGNDVFGAGPGTDTYNGGTGTDQVRYLDRPAVKVSLDGVANDGVAGENDSLIGIENLWGSSHNDVLIGDANANRIEGQDGNDRIQGLGGNDTVLGGGGEDRVEGGDGADRLLGGDYPDVLIGGAGADTLDGQAAQYFRNVCDADATDTVTRCYADSTPPTGYMSVQSASGSSDTLHPGEGLDVTFSSTDTGGTARADLRVVRSSDQTVLAWCPSKMTMMSDGTTGEDYFTAQCTVPADAVVPDNVTVQVKLTDQIGNVTAFGAAGSDPTSMSVTAAP